MQSIGAERHGIELKELWKKIGFFYLALSIFVMYH